jgi:hypothetical protein
MGHKNAGTNFPKSPPNPSRDDREMRYNTGGYYEANRRLGRSRDERPVELDDQDMYDDFHTGKQENYNAAGYYDSNYGSGNELNRGRDVEHNAGYRDNYDHLTTGQWPEVQEAADRRGMNLRWRELQARGVHRGKGPRSYQRSDYRISEHIHDVLLEDPYIDATDIEVKVEQGEVILSGLVENRHIKRRVEDVIEDQVSGIKHLENRLRAKQPGGPTANIDTNRR